MSVETSVEEWVTGLSLLWWWIVFFIIFGCGFVFLDDKKYLLGTLNIILGVWVGLISGALSGVLTSSFLVAESSSIAAATSLTTSICIASVSGVVAHKFKGKILGKIAKLVVIFFLALALVVQLLIWGIRSWS